MLKFLKGKLSPDDDDRRIKGFKFLFLAAFMSQASFIVESLIFGITKKALPLPLNTVFSALSAVLFYVALSMFFAYRYDVEKNSILSYIRTRALTFISSALGAAFIFALSAQTYKLYFSLFADIDKVGSMEWLIIGVYVAFILISLFLGMSFMVLMVAGYRYQFGSRWSGRVYRRILLGLLRKSPLLVLTGLALGVMAYMSLPLVNGLDAFAKAIFGYGFFKNYVILIISTLITSSALMVTVFYSESVLDSVDSSIAEVIGNKAGSPVFAFSIIGLSVVLMAITFPVKASAADMILQEVDVHMKKGEVYGQIGLSQKSISEYSMAFSKLNALKGYFEAAVANRSETKRLEYRTKSDESFMAADEYQPQDPYTSYLKGKTAYVMDGNDSGSLDSFYTSISMKNGIEESNFAILSIQGKLGNKSEADRAFSALMNSKIFYDYYGSLDKVSESKAERYLEKIDGIKAALGTKMVYRAVEKARYNDHAGAIAELLKLEGMYPDNPEIAYYLAQNYNTYRSEQSNYENVKKYAKEFDDLYTEKVDAETEISKKMFVSSMYMGASDYGKSIEALKGLHAKNPGNSDATAQYAYLLTETERYDEAISLLSSISESDSSAPALYYLRAISYLKKESFQKSLNDIKAIERLADSNKDLIPSFDYYVYLYSLQYSAHWANVEAGLAAEGMPHESILYSYLYAVKGWKDKRSDVSNSYIEKVIKMNGNLGYAHYINGINYYEFAVRNNTKDFSKAEKAYLKSISILPSHVEGYFALAHCYKKAGENLAALRAFRKVVDLMPYEDHRVDPYGMSVHSAGEISSLLQYEQGVK